MKCDEFWKLYEKNGLTNELEDHLNSCGSCKNEMEIENLLIEKVKEYPSYQAPESLWNNINEKLDENTFIRQGSKREGAIVFDLRQKVISAGRKIGFRYVAAAAVVIFMALTGLDYFYFNGADNTDMDIQSALANIEQAETEYITAMEKFTAVIETRKESLAGNSLYQLYTEKLALLDDYILECKEAIEHNEMNVNARTYLLLAYKEKVETLEAMSKLI
ncbi:hypothetical protein ACFL6G_04620 [candidate division KSB1 bacterium]